MDGNSKCSQRKDILYSLPLLCHFKHVNSIVLHNNGNTSSDGGVLLYNRRFRFIRFIFVLFLVFLAFRLFNIQTIKGEQYSVRAALQQSRSLLVHRERGDILDRNGIRLTGRKTRWKAILQPYTLLNDPVVLSTIASIFNVTPQDLTGELSKSNLPYLMDISSAQAKALSDSSVEGISVIDIRVRNDADTLASHILGYVDEKGEEGLAGIEKAYQETLRRGGGVYAGIIADAGDGFMSGLGYRIWNSMNREKLNVQLTLDYHLQSIIEKVMDRMVDKGAVILMDILTGEILAMASRPDFDPSNITPYLNDSNEPLFNRALGTYTPGSVFKIITAAAALEDGISADLTFDCPGYVGLGNLRMKCTSYNEGGHGNINMAQAFARSCNSYFINLGLMLGRDKIMDMAEKFGLGSKTGLAEQGIEEPAGLLPSFLGPASPAEIGNMSIGQGEILISPIQAANMTAVIANGGILNQVSLVKGIVNDKCELIRNINNPSWRRVISKETAAALQGMMLLTVQSGTGRWADIKGHGGSAGKTGSAETGWVKDNRNILHAWFSGYFPINEPRYSLCVFIEDGESGSASAAPIFAEISAQIIEAGY